MADTNTTTNIPDPNGQTWKDVGFDPKMMRQQTDPLKSADYIPGINFDATLDEMNINRILRPKNLPLDPQGNEPGKIYWNTTIPTLKVWINSTIGWFDMLNRLYGNMYQSHELGSQITVTISAKDTNTMVGSGITGGFTNGFTFQNARELKCLTAGKYLINWSMSVECATANQEVMGGVMIGGTAQEQTATHCEIITASKPQTVSGTGILSLAVNDLVQLYVENHTAANNILIDHLTCSVYMLAIT